MNADGTLVAPPVWTRANAGRICVIPCYPHESAFPLSCPGVAHAHHVGAGTPSRETAPPSSRGARQIAMPARVDWSGYSVRSRIIGIGRNPVVNRLVVACGEL